MVYIKKMIIKTSVIAAVLMLSLLSALAAALYAVPDAVKKAESAARPCASADKEAAQEELRGIWLPYMCLTLTEGEQSEDAFTKKICSVFDKCAGCGLNAVFMQVRPFSDALYKSGIFPWSHILTGVQGKDPGYDPLKIAVREAHKRALALHAWINPFRISTGITPPSLSDNNPYIRLKNESADDDEGFFFTYEGGLYFDPSSSRVRELIIDGVRELAENYDIDGIQIDDYFYPTEDESIDIESYRRYKSTLPEGSIALSHQEWRKSCINMLICGIYTAAHSAKDDIVFGIAPQCNFENDEKMSADIQSWCRFDGYADYICPQLYVSLEHPVFPFEKLAQEWCSVMKSGSTRLYFGLALYKVGTDADSGTWLTGEDIIKSQTAILRNYHADGFILYSYEYIGNYA